MQNNLPFINIHSHKSERENEQNIRNLFLSDYSKDTNCSLGIHPWYINLDTVNDDLKLLNQLAKENNVLVIGECGLDKLVDIDLTIQEKIFKEQIKIAELNQKPIIVHCVKAFDDLIRIKKECAVSVPMIVHGFNNNKQIAEQLLKNGFYISFGKALLKEGSNASKVICGIPIERIFLETDDADILIKTIFDKASQLKSIGIDELKEKMIINFEKIIKK